jgi:hypothetical protein
LRKFRTSACRGVGGFFIGEHLFTYTILKPSGAVKGENLKAGSE